MFAASTRLRTRRFFGVTSTSSSSLMNSIACSRLSRRGGIRRMASSARRRAHVRLLLLARDVDVHVVGPRVLADDHALVDRRRRARRTSRRAPAGWRSRRRSPRPGGRRPARRSAATAIGPCHGSQPAKTWCMMPVPRVSVRNCDRKPMRPRAGIRNSSRTRPLPWLTIFVIDAAADADLRDDHALIFLGDVDDEILDRLHHRAVDFRDDDLRARDLQLVALAAHHLDEDRELQLAAADRLSSARASRSARRESRRCRAVPCRAGP